MRIFATNPNKTSVTVSGVLREMGTVTTRPLLLLVDDDPIIVDSLGLVLEDNFTLYAAGTRNETKSLLRKVAKIPPLTLSMNGGE